MLRVRNAAILAPALGIVAERTQRRSSEYGKGFRVLVDVFLKVGVRVLFQTGNALVIQVSQEAPVAEELCDSVNGQVRPRKLVQQEFDDRKGNDLSHRPIVVRFS
jgi:hypothetical protein